MNIHIFLIELLSLTLMISIVYCFNEFSHIEYRILKIQNEMKNDVTTIKSIAFPMDSN